MSEQKICPYPGLRPFTEDESIYFKGREEHIEKIITQLEEKKFVMLTGASGDGKSSIVYAGVIPNARAGFFKAKFNSWLIADFRPERSPLKNLAIALSEKLAYHDVAFVEQELGFGFSSLIKLYKNSPSYLDQKSGVYIKADEKEKKTLRRKAANLFILVDQFEEFFTNAENYLNGKASFHSQAVLNLLLETAKIALAEDLPIYIVCTMRSDYIGQCAAFRGLPEYIGFSQFFVPRLKRKEIHQVIEEPAILSGNKISNRLTETLINEIGEGFDQLPVLQHALNQIWTQADKGNQEMDLIHLAKLSGLPDNYLPENDKEKFKDWFKTIPQFKKEFFKNPSLESVLNAHANELYETAFDYYNENHAQKITKETSHLVIKVVFQCLTKIDASRAVRNRMTLEELTNIINNPDINSEMVGGIIDYFRLQGNTFLKPFIISEETAVSLKKADILDITHESLIRNWDLLTEWANEEHENFLNFLDFNKQLERWRINNKDKGFLLPIGPLTFFEQWHLSCKPNKYWLARYDESDETKDQKLIKAEETLQLANEFLKKSSRNLLFSRFVLKHGANKLVAYAGMIILLVSCSFYYYDYTLKQNNHIVAELEERGLELLNSNKVTAFYKADFVMKYEQLNPGSFESALNNLENDTLAFDIADEMFAKIQNFETKEKSETIPELIYPLLTYLDGRLENLTNRQRVIFKTKKRFNLSRINKFLSYCAYVKSYDDSKIINNLIDKETWILNSMLTTALNLPIDSISLNTKQFANSVQLLIALAPRTDFKYYIEKISPVAFEESKTRFDKLFLTEDQNSEYAGYQLLAYLYAADNDPDNLIKITSCVDMALLTKSELKKSDYSSFYDVINILSKYNNFHSGMVDTILSYYRLGTNTNALKLRDKLISENFCRHIPYEKITEPYSNYNCLVKYFVTKNQREKIWDYYSLTLGKSLHNGKQLAFNASGNPLMISVYNENDSNFYTSLYYKKKGSYCIEVNDDSLAANVCFKKAFEYYNKLPQSYLSTPYNFEDITKNGSGIITLAKSYVFLYPKVLNNYANFSIDGRGGATVSWDIYGVMKGQSSSTAFLNFIIKNKLSGYYSDNEYIKILEKFCYTFYEPNLPSDAPFYKCVKLMQDIFSENPTIKDQSINQDFLALAEVNKYFELNDTTQALKLYGKIDMKKVMGGHFITHFSADEVNIKHTILIKTLAIQLALAGRMKESFRLLHEIKSQSEKRNLLTDIAYSLQEKGPVENTFYYLDTLFQNNDIDGQPKFGMKLIQTLAMVGSKEMFNICKRMMKDLPESVKPHATLNFIRGVAYNGYYYEARNYIPENVSSNKELQLINEILQIECRKKLITIQKTAKIKTKLKAAYQFSDLDYEGTNSSLRSDNLD